MVDPSGGAIAWLAPDRGGACVGYAVRASTVEGGTWTHVFSRPNSQVCAWERDPSGCTFSAAIPQTIVGRRADIDGGGKVHRWQLIERDPAEAVLGASVRMLPGHSAGSSARINLHLRLKARLDDASPLLDLEAHNEGSEIVRVGLGICPSFPLPNNEDERAFVLARLATRQLRSEGSGGEPPTAFSEAVILPHTCSGGTERDRSGHG